MKKQNMFNGNSWAPIGLLGGMAITVLCAGCQTWNGGYPLQPNTRIPPPGTGTYQVPANYYSGATNSVSQVTGNPYEAASGSTVVSAVQGGQVQPATFTSPIPSTDLVAPVDQGAATLNWQQ